MPKSRISYNNKISYGDRWSYASNPDAFVGKITKQLLEEPYGSLLQKIRFENESSVGEIRQRVLDKNPELKSLYKSVKQDKFPLLYKHFIDGFISGNPLDKKYIDICTLKIVLDKIISKNITEEKAVDFLKEKWESYLIEKFSILNEEVKSFNEELKIGELNKEKKTVYFIGKKDSLPNLEKQHKLTSVGYAVFTIAVDKEFKSLKSAERHIGKKVVQEIEKNEKEFGSKIENSVIIGMGANGSYFARIADALLAKKNKHLYGVELVNPEISRRQVAWDIFKNHPVSAPVGAIATIAAPYIVLPVAGVAVAIIGRDPGLIFTPAVMLAVEIKRLMLNNRNISKVDKTETPTVICNDGAFLTMDERIAIEAQVKSAGLASSRNADSLRSIENIFELFAKQQRYSCDTESLNSTPKGEQNNGNKFSYKMSDYIDNSKYEVSNQNIPIVRNGMATYKIPEKLIADFTDSDIPYKVKLGNFIPKPPALEPNTNMHEVITDKVSKIIEI